MKSEIDNEKGIVTQIVVNNSGIILLGPFLEVLFNRLNLIEERQFIDITSRNKAILLIHFAVTGRVSIEKEDDIVLMKILCGVDPNDHFDIASVLTKDEESLVESLLQSVINRWENIGTTSISGLRENFIQREGDLTEDNLAYILLVDRRPYDVLLDTIPWNIKSIKLPMMKKMLLVSW